MYHVCFSNPTAWAISYKNGVYGNVETGNRNPGVFWGKIIDLIALTPGDKVFFYVKERMCLVGLFEVVSEPYYCKDGLFNTKEKYPFRFNFKEIKRFENPIPVSELAKLIENGSIYSFTRFERDQNAQFRGIRQLTNEEGQLLEETFLRFNPKGDINSIVNFKHPKITKSLEAKDIISNKLKQDFKKPVQIKFTVVPTTRKRKDYYIAQYENSLQGYIYYCLRRNLSNVIEDVEVNNFKECLMEVPLLKAQQFRSDILCLYREGKSSPHFYSIIETKKDKKISIQDLSQLIGYMKTFASAKNISFNSLEGVYISSSFEEEAIIYLNNRKSVEKENPIRLIQYFVSMQGNVTFKSIEI